MSSHIFSNRQVVSRLLWKEFRQIQGLVFFVILLGIIAQIYCWTVAAAGLADYGWFLPEHVATMSPILFAMGCGVTIFTAEHENKTFLFQRLLPISRRQVLGTKIGLMAGMTTLLFLLFWSGALLIQASTSVGLGIYSLQMSANGLLVGEVLVWSLLFSMLEKRPLYAISKVILSCVGSIVLCYGLVSLFRSSPGLDDTRVLWLRGGNLVGTRGKCRSRHQALVPWTRGFANETLAVRAVIKWSAFLPASLVDWTQSAVDTTT